MRGCCDDCARFRSGDLPELVAASFACPLCLHTASWAIVLREDHGGMAACRCRMCDTSWRVHLDGWQLLRMTVAPPAGMLVAYGSGAGSPSR